MTKHYGDSFRFRQPSSSVVSETLHNAVGRKIHRDRGVINYFRIYHSNGLCLHLLPPARLPSISTIVFVCGVADPVITGHWWHPRFEFNELMIRVDHIIIHCVLCDWNEAELPVILK